MQSRSNIPFFTSNQSSAIPSLSVLVQCLDTNLFDKFNVFVNEFFDHIEPKKINPLSNLHDLLSSNFILGECHHGISPKNFLIQNMQLFTGFTIFVEGLYYDKHQKDLDDFCLNPESKLSPTLFLHLHNLNTANFPEYDGYCLSKRWLDNNYIKLIIAAKKAGIRIVGADISKSHEKTLKDMSMYPSTWTKNRLRFFNFLTTQIIHEEMKGNDSDGKWILLTGLFHAKTFSSTPGISDILGTPTLYIEDIDGLILKQETFFNVPLNEKQVYASHQFTSKSCLGYPPVDIKSLSTKNINIDIYMANNPFKNTPLLSLPHIEKPDDPEDDKMSFTEDQFNRTVSQYREYKNKYLGLGRFFSSKDSADVILKLVLANNGQDRLKIANEYITQHPDKNFSKELKKNMSFTR